MLRAEFLYSDFLKKLGVEPTSCQDKLLKKIAEFIVSDEENILVVNGYAGTGKTTALASVIRSLRAMKIKTVLLAPTGRSAKVLSRYTQRPANTVHKGIYRQKSIGTDGFGQFSLAPNKSKDTLFIVDEVSLIGVDQGRQNSSMSFGSGNLLEDLISFVRSGTDCKLILAGDSAQLPPVGLSESPALSRGFMDGFGGVDFATLTEVVRQSSESGILRSATVLRRLITDAGQSDIFEDVKLSLEGIDDVERVRGDALIDKISEAYDLYGEDETIILCRSNKRAIRYNLGIRSMVQGKEERLLKGDSLMIVKNCYQFVEDIEGMDFIANGDISCLQRISHFEDRYGLHFADARLRFPDYNDQETVAKVCLDTLESESSSLSYEEQNALYEGVNADYSHITNKKKRYEAVRENPFYNALQLKYAYAVTGHKSQGGQWDCVFIDCPFWADEQSLDDLKWLYTAITRAVKKVYLVNFPDRFFN